MSVVASWTGGNKADGICTHLAQTWVTIIHVPSGGIRQNCSLCKAAGEEEQAGSIGCQEPETPENKQGIDHSDRSYCGAHNFNFIP